MNQSSGVWSVVTHPATLVGVGGAVGGILRYYLGVWLNPKTGGFPWGTFAVNVSGSFIVAFLALLILEQLPEDHRGWFLLLGAGFCGGFTTFSTFEWELFQLIRDGRAGLALAYAAASLLAGFLGVLAAAGTLYLLAITLGLGGKPGSGTP